MSGKLSRQWPTRVLHYVLVSDALDLFGLNAYIASAEEGEPICIGDKGGDTTIYEFFPGRSIEIYVTDGGYIKGVRIWRHGKHSDVREAEVGDCPTWVDTLEDDE